MTHLRQHQKGFAMPAMFLAVLVAGLASLNVKTDDGGTVASAMGIDFEKQSEFSAVEVDDNAKQ